MSSWLNFNESLNSIKGQISTFASNVLADDEGTEASVTSNEDFKKLCVQKDLEIEHLKKINDELEKSLKVYKQQDGEPNDNNWDWIPPEITSQDTHPSENISHLRETIRDLENEKNDLLNQLEQLDLENQQNVTELVKIREKLQDENNELKDSNSQLRTENKALISKEKKLKEKLTELQNQLKGAQNSTENPEETHENVLKNNQELKRKLEEAATELSVLKSTHETLNKTLKNSQSSYEKEIAELTEKLKKSESENRIIYSELQNAKEIVKSAEAKSQEDAENCQRLAYVLETYDKEVRLLKEKLATSKTEDSNQQNEKVVVLKSQLDEALESATLLRNENKKLKNDFETFRAESEQQSKELRQQIDEKSQELFRLKQCTENDSENSKLKNEMETLKYSLEEKSSELESKHNMYINIMTDNIKRYIDSAVPPSEHHFDTSDDPHITEFSRQVENIFKILLEFKQKCESLEKDLIEASNEKTNILNEKYNEIEKLIQNSEMLSQEVIKKGEKIKELESELSNLITSNDVLLSELDSYKNPGLQTISESNEDNIILLETDLENANKRIKELEEIIDSPSKTATPNHTSEISQGNVSEKLEDYQMLLNNFDALKIDYDELMYKLEETNNLLNGAKGENEELKAQLDKLKADFENTDYQLTEANFTIESLKEELDSLKLSLENLQVENKKLKLNSMNIIDLKSELNEIKEKWLFEENLRRNLEAQVKNLTEKQQNAKMSETSLKLQYDTLSKEYASLLETKNNLEQSLSSAKTSIADYESNYSELLQKYDGVLLRCEELNSSLHEKENEILRLKQFEEENQKLEKTITENVIELKQCKEKLSQDENTIKLTEQLQKKEKEVEQLILNLKNIQSHKTELEQTTLGQKQEIENYINKEVSLQEHIRNLESQLHAKKEELVQVTKPSERMQQHSEDLEGAIEEAKSSSSEALNAVNLLQEKEKLEEEINKCQITLQQNEQTIASLHQQIQELANSRNELINMITVKHQESLNYHNEIQRLSEILKNEAQKTMLLESKLVQVSETSVEIAKKNEEIDKLSGENNFLKEKCDVLSRNLLEEQSKLQQLLSEKNGHSEKEVSLSKQLERLQSHLMELEEHYTQELLEAEQKNVELQAKVTDLEQREKNSSTMYTSVSIRANQQVETLQKQLQMVTNQREELRKKISDAEDLNVKQAAALANLQFVLEQFQKDKEKDVQKETERIRRQINVEKQVQNDLRNEIDNLKAQLEESKIGLQAASRLSDQLELLKKQNSALKEEVSQLQQKLSKSQQTIHELTSQTDGKIDKTLIKNLIVGFLSSGISNNWNKDQTQVLKLIATVLDFNQQDHDKVNLNRPQHGSWLGSLLFPQPNSQNMTQESLSQAFVKFLENESRPRVVPSLLGESSSKQSNSTESSSKRSTPRASPSPIILNEVVLPTFADFGQSRNSSSILKDVLKDNNN